MKKFKIILHMRLLVLFGCIIILNANAQMPDTTSNMRKPKIDADVLYKKAKLQKKGAMISLIVGGVITTAGFLYEKSGGDALEAAAIIVSGAPFILFSIPLFIISANNKNKAELILKHEKVFLNPQSNLEKHIVSLGIKIKL